MNAFQIKVAAIVFMIIDHMGLFFFPQYLWFRIIGRISFPLFAWLIANGAQYTHDIKKYLTRLYFFALLSQISFFAANQLIDPHFTGTNVLCTLFFGLFAIYFIQRTKRWFFWLPITIFFAVLAEFLQTDYGGFGVAVIVAFYLFFNNFKKLVIAQVILFFAEYILQYYTYSVSIEYFGLLALLFIWLYNKKPGMPAKYIFYVFYPLQYVIYYFLLIILSPLLT